MGGVDAIDTLPWSTDLTFQVLRYGISHKTLVFRHGWKQGEPAYEIEFESVEWMELGPHYDGLTITPLREYGRFNDSWWQPLLLLDLRDAKGRRGFVACNRVAVAQVEAFGGREGKRERLSGLAAPFSELGVGGVPAGPNGSGALRTHRLPTAEERAAVVP